MLDVEVEASGGEGVVGRGGVALDQLGEDGLDEAKGHLGLGLDRGHAKHSDEGLRGLQKMSGNRKWLPQFLLHATCCLAIKKVS